MCPKLRINLTIRSLNIADTETEYLFAYPRKFAFDWAWPSKKLAIEYEGIVKPKKRKSRHTTIKGYSGDCVKYSLANILGWRIIRATAITVENGQFAKLLRMAYFGWKDAEEYLGMLREL